MVSQLYLEPDKSVASKPVADKSALFKKAPIDPRAFVIKKILSLVSVSFLILFIR
jgi:hypothetical protein